MILHPEQNYFNQECIWNHTQWSEHEEKRLQKTRALVPEDAFSIVDIGCGDGTLINQLKKNVVVGVDFSRTALKKVRTLKVLTNVSHLPFRDHSFDCVICTGLLEHLDNGVHKNAIMEIQRVSSKYLLVGVPFNENLLEALCRCPNCGNKFHAYLHKRRYDVRSIKEYFAGFKLLKLLLFNGHSYYNSVLLKIRQDICGSYSYNPKAICPRCGYSFSSGEPPKLTIINRTVSVICALVNFFLRYVIRPFKRDNATSLVILMEKRNALYSTKTQADLLPSHHTFVDSVISQTWVDISSNHS